MFSNILNAVEGIATYPMISLVMFFLLFVGIVWHVVRMKKEDEDEMSRLPLN